MTDPMGNDTERLLGGSDLNGTFISGAYASTVSNYSGCSPHDTTTYCRGTGSLLKSDSYAYRTIGGASAHGVPSYQASPPQEPYLTQTSLITSTGAVVRRTVNTFAPAFVPPSENCQITQYPNPQVFNSVLSNGNQVQTNQQNCYDPNAIIQTDEYDWGAGQPGALIKTTLIRYEWQNDLNTGNKFCMNSGQTGYLAVNLMGLKQCVQVTSGGASGTVLSETDYGYDESGSPQGTIGNLTSTTQINFQTGTPSVSKTVYNSQGMPSKQTDPKGNSTQIYYDNTGVFPNQVTLPSTTAYGTTVTHNDSYVFDSNTGHILSHLDQNGRKTTYSYVDPASGAADTLGRLHQVTYPQTIDGTVGGSGALASGYTTYTYDDTPGSLSIKQQTLQTSAGQLLTEITNFDELGEVISSTDAAGAIIKKNYDAAGRLYSVSNPQFTTGSPTDGTTYYTYDALGRLIQRNNQDNTLRMYSYAGNAATETDELQHAWTRTSDGLGRLVSVVEPGSLTTSYTYDSLSNLKSVTQQGSSAETPRARSFSYDSLSRLLTSANPETGIICYGTWSGGTVGSGSCASGYDLNGNLIAKTDARGVTTAYSYDALNRILSKTYSGNNSAATAIAAATLPTNYGYDSSGVTNGIGRLSTESTGPASTPVTLTSIQAYDAMGRVQSKSTSAPNKSSGASVTYDLAGHQTSMTYPDGRVIQSGVDTAGRINAVTYVNFNGSTANLPQTYFSEASGYDPASHLAKAAFGNGVAYAAGYDNRERFSTLTYGLPSAPSWSKQYAWAPNGNLQSQTDLITGIQRQFNYDSLNRLSAAQDIYSNLAVASGSNDNTGSTSSSGSGASEAPGVTGALPEWTNPDDSNLLTDFGASAPGWAVGNEIVSLSNFAAPDGTNTATVVTASKNEIGFGVEGSTATPFELSMETMTGSVWLRILSGSAAINLNIMANGSSVGSTQVTVGTTWQQYQVTKAVPDNLTSLTWRIGTPTSSTLQQFIIWHPMLEDKGIAGSSVTNYLPYSQRLTASTWTPASASTVVKDNVVAAPDGTLTAASLTASSGTTGQITNSIQNPAPFDGQPVYASVWLRAAAAQSVALGLMEVNPSNGSTPISLHNYAVTTAWTRFLVSGTAQSALSQLSLQIGGSNTIGLGQTVYVWGAQMELATTAGPYVATAAAPVTAGTTLTNLLTYSQKPENWSPNSSIAVTPNIISAPDGSMTASRVTAQSADSNIWDGAPNAGLYDGATVTGSVYLKLESGSPNLNLYIYSIDAASGTTQYFTTLPVVLNSVWQRFEITGAVPASVSYLVLQIGGATSFKTGQVIDLWGAQMEIASQAGPYISTTALPIITGGNPTNILPSSQSISGTNWQATGTVTNNGVTAPDGTTTATIFTGTSGAAGPPATGDNWVVAFVPNPSLYDAETVTGSVYLRVTSGTQNVNLYFDTVGDQGTLYPTSLAAVTTTWQRFALTGTLQNGLKSLSFQIGGGNSLPYGTSIQIWGAQFVVGSDPAPYTPTSTTTTVYSSGLVGTPVPTGLGQVYSYDSFGNILQNGSFQTNYTATNQIFGYAYDFAGNLLSDGMNIMTWDAESRMATVGGATYIYDAEGNRVEKQGSAVTDTVYFGGQPIARYSNGQWTDLIYGPTGLLAEVPGLSSGQPTYRVTDNLGTNVGSLLANGTFVDPIDHTPFGQVFTGNTSDPYFFTGKERDAESGMDFFGARYYSSNMGRMLSPDWSAKAEPVPYAKLNNPQSLNLYEYVLNNPLATVDADGHSWLNRYLQQNSINAELGQFIQNQADQNASKQAQQQNSSTTTVTLNNRQANIPGGAVLDAIGIDHQWISTPDGTAVGMGTAQGVPQSDAPGVQTQVVNHAGEVATSTQTFTGVDKAALGTYTKVGTPTGRWIPGVNDCNTWAYNAIHQSTPHDIIEGGVVSRTGVSPRQIVYHNVVVYADGSIHSPGAP